jgi:hypothetical protein
VAFHQIPPEVQRCLQARICFIVLFSPDYTHGFTYLTPYLAGFTVLVKLFM